MKKISKIVLISLGCIVIILTIFNPSATTFKSYTTEGTRLDGVYKFRRTSNFIIFSYFVKIKYNGDTTKYFGIADNIIQIK